MSTILVADDEDFMRLLVRQTLEAHRVVEAESGSEALTLAKEGLPDLIILDWMMPGMDGPAVLEALRGDEKTCTIPVVMVTGRVSKQEQQFVLDNGADSCLSKPFSPSDLRACVEELLGAV